MTDLIERLTDTHSTERRLAACDEAADEIERLKADVLHWKGMTKGRESEIDKHLAEIKRLRAALEAIIDDHYEAPAIAAEALKDD